MGFRVLGLEIICLRNVSGRTAWEAKEMGEKRIPVELCGNKVVWIGFFFR